MGGGGVQYLRKCVVLLNYNWFVGYGLAHSATNYLGSTGACFPKSLLLNSALLRLSVYYNETLELIYFLKCSSLYKE